MKMTMAQRDVLAIESGMKNHNTDSKGFLKVVEGWVESRSIDEGTTQYNQLLHLRDCAKTYIQWGM